MRHYISDWVVRHPWMVIALTLAITAGLAGPMTTIRVNTDVEAFMPHGDDAIDNLHLLKDVFGSPLLTMIIVMREDHPDGIYNPESLALLLELTDWLRSQDYYETGTNADLRSLGSVNDIRSDGDDMIVDAFFDKAPANRAEALAVRDRVLANGIYVGALSAWDGTGAAILVRNSEYGIEHNLEAYRHLRSFLDEKTAEGHPEVFHLTGRPVVEAIFGFYIPDEGRRMMPFVLALIAVCLAIAFRTIRGVALPLLVIATTEVWMLGLHGLWGQPFFTVSSILPVLVIAVSVADAIHLMARYYEIQRNHPAYDRDAVVRSTVHDMARPVFLTSLTTAVGFASMTISAVEPIHDFGITMIFGIVSAWVLSIVFLPAMLAVLPLRGQRSGPTGGRSTEGLTRLLGSSADLATTRPRTVVAVFAALAVLCLAGTTRLRVDSSQVTQFRPSHEIRVADAISNSKFAGGTVLDVLIDGRDAGSMQNPAMLRSIVALQEHLEEDEQVGDSISIAEMIARMNRIMHGDDARFSTIPEDRELVAQYLLLYSISGDPGDFDDLVDYEYRYAHVIVFLRDSGTALSRKTVAHARTLIDELFADDGPSPADVRLTGPAYTVARMESHISRDQLTTLILCTPLLVLLNWGMFRNSVAGFLSIVPVLFAVACTYGAMGFIGLPADVATVMLGGMTLGIGVDFAIHYLHRYRQVRPTVANPREAARETSRTAGLALFVNMAVLTGGFLAMLGSRFYPQMKLGTLVALTMIVCYLATMYLFPAVLLLSDRGEGRQ